MDQYRYRRSKSTQSLQNASGRTTSTLPDPVNGNSQSEGYNSDMS